MTEEGIAAYTEKMHQAYKLAKYEVLEAKKAEDGSYIVKVKAEPGRYIPNFRRKFYRSK